MNDNGDGKSIDRLTSGVKTRNKFGQDNNQLVSRSNSIDSKEAMHESPMKQSEPNTLSHAEKN